MTFANFFERFNQSGAACALLIAFASLTPAQAGAQEADAGYKPPQMFQDMTPPMVRPETPTGNLVEPMSSSRVTLDNAPMQRPAAITRYSADAVPEAAPKTSAPTITTRTVTTSTTMMPNPDNEDLPPLPAPVVEKIPVIKTPDVKTTTTTVTETTTTKITETPATPSAPVKKMQPIVDEHDVALDKKKDAPAAEKKPKAVKEKSAAKPEAKKAGPKPDVEKPVKPESIDKPLAEAPVAAPSTPPAPIEMPAVPATPEPVATSAPKADTPIKAEEAKAKAPAAPTEDDRTQQVKPVGKSYESAIKGPKTMPSVPAQSVDAEKTFQTEEKPAADAPTIMERTQDASKTEKSEDLKPAAVSPPPGVTPATFDPGEHGALKKEITFPQGQIKLEESAAQTVAAGVYAELSKEGHEEWRVQIQSYATSYGDALSSDRRISLARALSMRTNLIQNGVAANRIDILAEGMDSGTEKPGDRIDLILFGPTP